MDYSKLPKLSATALVLAIILGVVFAVVVYQAQIRGLLPVISGNPVKPESLKLQTVIGEESSVTSAIENITPAIVSISLAGVKSESAKIGTGFIADSRGFIITSKSTVSAFGQYVVMTGDGQKFEVKKIYNDPTLDLSLLVVAANNLKAPDLGDSSKLKLGQTAIAVGKRGQAVSVSVGVISGLNGLIQTDALIDSDYSGGPLLSSAGQLIGINLVVPEPRNFGSAIPVNIVKQLIISALQGPAKPVLGLTYKFISNPAGATVQEVSAGSAADKAGIKVGDIITKVDGQKVDSEDTIFRAIAEKQAGNKLSLTIWSNGIEKTLTAILQESLSK